MGNDYNIIIMKLYLLFHSNDVLYIILDSPFIMLDN